MEEDAQGLPRISPDAQGVEPKSVAVGTLSESFDHDENFADQRVRFLHRYECGPFFERGGSEDKIFSLSKYRESSVYCEREKVALEYAGAVTITSEKVTDQLFSRLKVHFNEDAIVELTALIAYQNLSSKFNSALKAEAFGFCKRN